MINFAVMSNTIRSIRKMSRKRVDPEELCPDVMQELRQMQTELSAMIDTLPNLSERIVMFLVFLEGHEHSTVAEEMGISERSVFRHMKSGKAELLKMYPGRIVMS